ncbi:NifB/NifX family molybdenum-iron cluster-binding protein [Candidatus Formimonas warabiya]|uniref:Dinitrogenase iron-molybdenum cofactor biosynthesis domain-containing protein n=1 Tax=Formimonas warabiya TaxID=1761012 RepID=A0A3G1KYH6_FORW1|nr:hypothetical protein [Candidatus Formimonas warabiya]ATW27528.1 hypothetical protein DCMF_24705 [Candidatus Formimonas warabiya]
MTLAIAVFDDRVSVTLDNCTQLLLVAFKDNLVCHTRPIPINGDFPLELVRRLKEEAVETLVCGAVSNSLRQLIETSGIKIVPWISGSVEQVLQAFRTDTLENLLMPGCCRRW